MILNEPGSCQSPGHGFVFQTSRGLRSHSLTKKCEALEMRGKIFNGGGEIVRFGNRVLHHKLTRLETKCDWSIWRAV
jgi:hypothetical protein